MSGFFILDLNDPGAFFPIHFVVFSFVWHRGYGQQPILLDLTQVAMRRSANPGAASIPILRAPKVKESLALFCLNRPWHLDVVECKTHVDTTVQSFWQDGQKKEVFLIPGFLLHTARNGGLLFCVACFQGRPGGGFHRLLMCMQSNEHGGVCGAASKDIQ